MTPNHERALDEYFGPGQWTADEVVTRCVTVHCQHFSVFMIDENVRFIQYHLLRSIKWCE